MCRGDPEPVTGEAADGDQPDKEELGTQVGLDDQHDQEHPRHAAGEEERRPIDPPSSEPEHKHGGVTRRDLEPEQVDVRAAAAIVPEATRLVPTTAHGTQHPDSEQEHQLDSQQPGEQHV